MKADPHGLNVRQRRFVQLLMEGKAAGRAYEAAGYVARGATADALASRMITFDKVKAAVESARESAQAVAEMNRADLVCYLVEVLRTPIGEISENHRLCQEWNLEPTTGAVRVKMPSKLSAAKQLAEIMGWNKPQEVKVDLSDKLADIIARVRGE